MHVLLYHIIQTKRITDSNRTFNKLSAQWLNDALCFVLSSVLAESLVLRNPLLRQAPKRYLPLQNEKTIEEIWIK